MEEETSCFSNLNRRLLLGPKFIFTAMAMIYYGFYLYRPTFLKQELKFTTAQYGYLSGMMAAVSFCFMAVWGYVADRTGKPKQVLATVSIGTAGAFSLFLVTSAEKRVLNILLLAVFAAFVSGFQAMCDDQVLRLLSFTGQKSLYGPQRVWEALSFSVTTRLLGFLIRRFGLISIHIWMPIAAAIFIVVVMICGTNRLDKDLEDSNAEQAKEAVKTAEMSAVDVSSTTNLIIEEEERRPLAILLSNRHYIFLLVGVFLTGCARSVMSNFLTLYLTEYMGLDEEQAATAAISGVILEVFSLLGSAFCIRTLGIYWMLIVAQLAMVLRAWVYVWMAPVKSNWWLVYLVELLKGLAFAFTQTAGVRLANEVVPPGLEATSQSLYTGMYSQLPAVLVACLGGMVIERFGADRLFLGTAVLATASLLLFLVKYTVDGHITFKRR